MTTEGSGIVAERDALAPRSLTEAELVGWGRRVGAEVPVPCWIALHGPLGAGKSVLARAIARGAGVAQRIPSPSFTLVQRYRSERGFEVYHVDLFRLRPGDAIAPLGWEELLHAPALVLLEWANRAGDQQPEARWEVMLNYGDSPDVREARVRRMGTAPELLAW